MPESIADNRRRLRALAEQKPTEVEQVVTVLADIAETASALERGKADGIACFSRLYHRITADVLDAYEKGQLFHCGKFIYELDLAFAQRYLDALRDWLDEGSDAPGCWQLLFARRQEDLAEWRFAVAGVNAHVNFDLAFALLDVWQEHDTPLATTADQYEDYVAINTIFHNRMDELCEDNKVPWTDWGAIAPDGGIIDRIGNLVGDVLVRGTRDFAWTHAERWYPHRKTDGYRVGPTAMLDVTATKLAQIFI
ncbi:DUF5995 family protein [Actinomycetospora aeridis]|uniref:DUF5995 family protein n=1 Tax=Actinomycetospora aeridis TaxID=3129231 RepID=A0ABU8N3Y1_9PSEU